MLHRLPLALLSVTCLLAASPASPAPPPAWPQTTSDLPADPAVRFGVLPNGMRYAVMRNATPAGQTSLRLRIGSGSLEESDAEQGLAHVLEHMAFKGSAHVPAGEMIKILQRKGLAFGPDTNAETGWTQTVYMLDLPRSDEATLTTGLMLMRETAGELTLDAKALASERGVVLSEERLRDTPAYRAERAQIDLWLPGQLAARRWPIGQVAVVENAPASLVRQFYQANYRPDRATLIAVGDFDPAAMEAKIKAEFSDWKSVAALTPEPDLGAIQPRGLTVKVIQLSGASTRVAVAWARPHDASPDTADKEARETVENLGLAVLNRRLGKLAQGATPPFLRGGVSFEDLFHSAKIAVVEAESTPDGWRAALRSAEQEVRRLRAYGIGQDELDREIAESRATVENAVAGAATRPTPTLAAGLVQTVDEAAVFTAPARDLIVFEAAVKNLKADRVNRALAGVFAGAGPLISLTTPQPVAGGEAAVAEAYAQAAAAPLSASATQAAIVWPYADFGRPGTVTDRKAIADLGVITARFANGVGLTVKSTAFRKDQVLVAVSVGGGRLELAKDRPSATWALRAFTAGGLRKITIDDAQRALAGTLHGESFSLTDDAFVFEGATQPRDLATQLQILAAYVTDPGYRPEAFERLRGAYLAALPQMAATPDGVLGRDLPALMTRGDPRWAFPSQEALTSAKAGDLKALLQGPLSTGPIEVTIVGDIAPDRAIAMTAATFGALPARAPSRRNAPGAARIAFPASTALPVERTHEGRPDQALAVVAWPADDFFADMQRSRAGILAGEVLGNRLVDKIRIAEGATYSPQARVDLSQTFAGYGYGLAEVEIPPAKIPGFFASVASITADMRTSGVTPDEFERARNPHVAGLKRAQLTNEYWLADLTGSLADPRRLNLIRTTLEGYEKLTAGDVQAVAKAWFTDDRAWRLVIRAKLAEAGQ